MKIDQRIKILIDLTCEGNQRAFAKKISAKPQTINNLISRNSAPGFKLIQQILREYPRLNPRWLILGEGDIGKDFQDQYINKSGYNVAIQETQAPYGNRTDQTHLLTQRVSSLEREVELLEQIIKEKELLIEHLSGKKG